MWFQFAFLPFPYLNTLSLTYQFLLLVFLSALSYFYRRIRLGLLGLVGLDIAWVVGRILLRWGFASFKAIAWFGFYVNFFLIGVGYILTAATTIWNLPETLAGMVENVDR